jgi:hypothetical protein
MMAQTELLIKKNNLLSTKAIYTRGHQVKGGGVNGVPLWDGAGRGNGGLLVEPEQVGEERCPLR